ncbi:DUF6913 domain-containing protein [Mongoliitalea daihaiensis]|uniref:DUF6913 domain-containing protein n=1 Tax=Mongoliitalea daihaiensis TaxID=2782006 RepID=UPI001F1C177B|nr:hypothetical protein [Mongoliitalea daihaiensis]UJP63517.1 hypothetical protein IPZ59_11750 [Mongoliitalea daihaiensis]
MKWIKDLLVNWRLKQLLKKVDLHQRGITVPTEIKTIGILAENFDALEEAKILIRKEWGLKVRIIAYHYSEENSTQIEAFSHKHFTWSGLPSDRLNNFMDEQLDFILVSSAKLNPYLRYLLLTKKDSFAIGFYSSQNKPYFDLMLAYDASSDLSGNLNLLIEYLLKIKRAC